MPYKPHSNAAGRSIDAELRAVLSYSMRSDQRSSKRCLTSSSVQCLHRANRVIRYARGTYHTVYPRTLFMMQCMRLHTNAGSTARWDQLAGWRSHSHQLAETSEGCAASGEGIWCPAAPWL